MAGKQAFDREVTRRGFLGMGVAAGGAVVLADELALAAGEKTDVWVLHGTVKKKLMDAALKVIADNGGFGKSVKKLTLKINAAWWSTPEQGGNTNPELADTFLKGCRGQGIKQLVMPENPVQPAEKTFPQSGLLAVAKSNGVPMIDLKSDEKLFKEVEIPKGKRLKKVVVAKDFLETDALVNMPVAKHHGGAGLTICMKNWMGAVATDVRRFFHRNDLHQCIADFSTFIKPNWAIVDATRIMLDRGPRGPSKNMKKLDLLIVSKDQVAADIYTATLFPEQTAGRAKHLKIATEMKLGTTDFSQMAIHKIEVS